MNISQYLSLVDSVLHPEYIMYSKQCVVTIFVVICKFWLILNVKANPHTQVSSSSSIETYIKSLSFNSSQNGFFNVEQNPTHLDSNINIINNGVCFGTIHQTASDNYCCKGYHRYKHDKTMCVPKCVNCKNGFCVSPGVCRCFPGFVKSLAEECVDTCPLGCLNGRCHANGTCFCSVGYKFLSGSKQICVPHCSKECSATFNCTAPNTCDCKKGYQSQLINGTLKCVPKCNPVCGQGECVAPYRCLCKSGYKLINGSCQGNCSRGCDNGRCVDNNKCECDPGWTLHDAKHIFDRVKCLPVCRNCMNGKCIGPENCKCNDGYKKDGNKCNPVCDWSCTLHGKCISPKHCQCKFNYKPTSNGGCKKESTIHVTINTSNQTLYQGSSNHTKNNKSIHYHHTTRKPYYHTTQHTIVIKKNSTRIQI